ncbi:FMN-dependent NADH-azoreductase [subsurface metagenome]
MKIVAINSSHRGDSGYSRFLIDKLFQGATAAGAECEVVTLANLKINRCLACDKCHTPKQYLKCVYDGKDDVRMVFDKMAEADIIVFAAPVYVLSMPGLLKTFLDRLNATGDTSAPTISKSGLLFHRIDRAICSKPFVVLVCCNSVENETPKNVLSYFRTYSKFHDAPQVGTLIRNAGRLSGYGKDREKEKRVPRIFDVYKAYEQAGQELATINRIRRSTQRRANQEIVPIPLFRILKRLKPFKKYIKNVLFRL